MERVSEEQLVEEDDLRDSLAALATLATNHLGLEDTLTRVAIFAVRAIPGADGAGLTLLEEGRSDTIVASAEFVREVDAIQYSLGQGPCISAAAQAQTVMSGSLGADRRWPQNAQVLAQARRLAASLQSALDSRGIIDRAVGIMMSRSGRSEQEALARLRDLSQHDHRKLGVVAQQIIDEAVRRARLRHRPLATDDSSASGQPE